MDIEAGSTFRRWAEGQERKLTADTFPLVKAGTLRIPRGRYVVRRESDRVIVEGRRGKYGLNLTQLRNHLFQSVSLNSHLLIFL